MKNLKTKLLQTCLSLVLAMLGTTVLIQDAAAQKAGLSLAQRAEWERGENELNEKIPRLYYENLGKQFKITFVKESFSSDAAPFDVVNTWGQMAIEGVNNVAIKGATEKKAVNGAIQQVELSFGKPSFSLAGTTLKVVTDMGASYNAATMRDEISKWIMNNL
jgi:hypothetical protein